ncbi:MAG: hypothetical protein KC413_14950 [Anaerolineales bacterium]|nr:hypothetical protein [Anaerolineales bacterium]
MLLGGGIAYAAPMLWSYPDDHLLISEVNYTGSPGTGTGTEWVELYNPTNTDVNYENISVQSSEFFWADVSTPTPGPEGTITPYPPINSHCFIYLAYDAAAFYNEFNQCPDHAQISDPINCPEVDNIFYWSYGEIPDNDNSLCLYIDYYYNPMIDAVGWGSGGEGNPGCAPIINPVPNGSVGETYLRGSDAPEWIGPGAEGEETPGAPQTEQLDEVWHLSGSVNVPWEGPEVGACRQPTAIGLQNPRASAAQDSGYALLLFGLIGLAVTTTAIVWRKGQN